MNSVSKGRRPAATSTLTSKPLSAHAQQTYQCQAPQMALKGLFNAVPTHSGLPVMGCQLAATAATATATEAGSL